MHNLRDIKIDHEMLRKYRKKSLVELLLFTAMVLTDELAGRNHLDGPADDISVTLASIRPHPRTTRVLL